MRYVSTMDDENHYASVFIGLPKTTGSIIERLYNYIGYKLNLNSRREIVIQNQHGETIERLVLDDNTTATIDLESFRND